MTGPTDDATVLFDGDLFADYHGIALADGTGFPDLPMAWTDADVGRRILAGPGGVIISTARNLTVPVRVTLHAAAPPIPDGADHAVRSGVVTTGEIAVAGLTEYWPTAARAPVPPGPLGVLAVSFGLGTLSPDGLDGDDRYAIHLWPAPSRDAVAEVVVLRQWTGN